MNKALLIWYILIFINLLSVANLHGTERSNYNFWTTLMGAAMSLSLIWWMLGWNFY